MSIDLGLEGDEKPEPAFEELPPRSTAVAVQPSREIVPVQEPSRNGHSSNAELYLISGLMVAPEDAPKAAHLPPDAFEDKEARLIWGAMTSGLRWPFDLFAFERNTGIPKARLFEISNLLPTSTQTSNFIGEVEEAWRVKRVKRIGAEMREAADGDPQAWIRRLESVAAKRRDTNEGKPITHFTIPEKGDRSVLLGNRFLNRGDGMVLSSTSGMGKSSLARQMMVSFALGRPFHGIKPNGPLISLEIQAEDSDGDIGENWTSLRHAMKLTETETALVEKRVTIVTESVLRGKGFIDELRRLIAIHKPDLVWINPLQSFIEGDITNAKDLSDFLAGGLNSLNKPGVLGFVLVHHTTKPATGKDREERLWHEVMYDMAGGAQIINWARAIISLRAAGESGEFNLVLAKRGMRAGVTRKLDQGVGFREEIITSIPLRHSDEMIELPGRTERLRAIFWEERTPSAEEGKPAQKGGRPPQHKFADFMPAFAKGRAEAFGINQVIRNMKQIKAGIGNSTGQRIVDEAVSDGFLKVYTDDKGRPKYWVE